jgi:hypothetical protein
MRFVPMKSVEQQATLALHRARQGFVMARTAQSNQLRGHVLAILVVSFGRVRASRASIHPKPLRPCSRVLTVKFPIAGYCPLPHRPARVVGGTLGLTESGPPWNNVARQGRLVRSDSALDRQRGHPRWRPLCWLL